MGTVLDLVLLALVVAALVWWWGVRGRAAQPRGEQQARPRRDEQAVARPSRPPVLSSLGEAIRAGDLERVTQLLDEDADPNEAAWNDMPALFAAVAAYQDDDRIVRLLLARGADRAHVVPEVGSVLAFTFSRKAHALAHLFIDEGVPLDLTNDGGATALHMAAYVGDAGMVALLIDRGIPVDARSFLQGTPLRAAAEAGHREVVELLLARGADPEPVDAFGKVAAEYAMENDRGDIVELLDRASKQSADEPPPVPPEGGPGSIRHFVWERGDASIRGAASAIERGARVTRQACSSLEAPAVLLSLRRVMGPELTISTSLRENHDAREPIGEVAFRLWTYEGLEPRATITPKPETRALVGAFASRPYSLDAWSAVAKELAADLDEDAIDDVLAVMTDPPEGPPYLTAWDFWFRAQIAAALLVSHVGATPWGESRRRARLLDLTRGPADWANSAAIIALFDVARRDPSTSDDIRDGLLALTRLEMTPPRYQHVMRPAALVLRELGGLDADTVRELDELIHPPIDDE